MVLNDPFFHVPVYEAAAVARFIKLKRLVVFSFPLPRSGPVTLSAKFEDLGRSFFPLGGVWSPRIWHCPFQTLYSKATP